MQDVSVATANEIHMDTAIAAVLSDLAGIFALKEEQRAALKAFLSG